MQDILKAVCRRFARRIHTNGVPMLTHDGDPTLAMVFDALGWGDAHPEADATSTAPPLVAPAENATVRDIERAILPGSEGHKA